MSTRTKVKDSYQVTYTVTIPEDIVEKAKKRGHDIEDCAWNVMEATHVKPTIKKIKGSLCWTILGPYITHPDQSYGPAYFEDLPSNKFMELLYEKKRLIELKCLGIMTRSQN